jgi:hypothetical protein
LLDNRYPLTTAFKPPEARLFLISPSDNRVQDASKCMGLHPCTDERGLAVDCTANDLNQQLDGALPNGLGFDGLKNPEEAQVILAFYQPTTSSEDDGGCHRSDLVACGGLAAPLGGGPYDISCASCLGGSRTAPGSDTGPCPKGPPMMNSCFLKICDTLLADNGFD